MVSAAEIARLRESWTAETGRPPGRAEESALVGRAVDEQILFEEALARGLDREDDVVRRRLVELARFVSSDPDADERALYEEALGLGLGRHDLVVRRRLIEKMRLVARRSEAPAPVSDAELEAIRDRSPDRYRIPPRATLTHVYLSRSRRGAAAEADARRLLEEIRSAGVDPSRAPALGDPFHAGSHVIDASDRDLERILGASFASAVASLGPGEWLGPVRSAYGEHLVWVHERQPAKMPALESIRTQLLEQLREERAEERLRATLGALRARITVRIEAPGLAVPRTPRAR